MRRFFYEAKGRVIGLCKEIRWDKTLQLGTHATKKPRGLGIECGHGLLATYVHLGAT